MTDDQIRTRKALRAAENALRRHACHGGPKAPCLRTPAQCASECGREAGDALLLVEAALKDTGKLEP